MTNKQILRQILNFREARLGWLEILAKNGDSVQAAQHILSINTKIEFLKTLWNHFDESVDFPY